MTDDQLRQHESDLINAAGFLIAAHQHVDRCMVRRDIVIRDSYLHGMSPTAIAKAANLTRQQVHKIIKQ